jgi:predicted nucleotide-binding protein (sugar kinase/HSP70/actin superfamily)
VEVIDVPDNESLRYGKEFGNRGQCNPTYFTVGNLVKFLTGRCRDEGIQPAEAVQRYVFLTAGACGPVSLRHVRHRIPQGPTQRRL